MTDSEETISCLEKWVEVAMHLSMRNFIRYSKENNISMSQIGTLFHLQRKGIMGVTDVGAHLGITSAAASQMIEKLVQQNLIERTEDPHDRRVRQLTLTKEGLAVLQGGLHARQAWMGELIAKLSPDEQKQVVKVLDLLIEKSRQIDAQSAPDPTA